MVELEQTAGATEEVFAEELLQLARERLGDREQACAVVSHAVEALRRRRRGGQRVGNPKAFLFQTVRTMTVERPSPSALRLAMPKLSGRPDARHARYDTEQDYLRRLRVYDNCLASLSRRDRKLFMLRRLHGLKTQQVAERSGLPAAMVESRLASALRKFWRAVRPREHQKLDQKDPVLPAIAWYTRLEGGALPRDQLLELECWLREDQTHARAFRIAESLWRDSALLQAVFNDERQTARSGAAFPRRILPRLFRKLGDRDLSAG